MPWPFAANVVLEGACERVIVGDLYCDVPLGLYVIRGENVVLIGELVWFVLDCLWSFDNDYMFLKGVFIIL
jgi:hypothetical protein